MDYTVQVQQIMETGSRPEDWLVILRRLEADPHLVDTTNRYRSLCSMYNRALKSIVLDKNKANPAYAQICIQFAKLKMTHDPDGARVFFKYARANIKTLAIVHVEAAQFELNHGDRNKCKDILRKAQNLQAEPLQMVATAIQRFNMGMASLCSEQQEPCRSATDQSGVSSKPPAVPQTAKISPPVTSGQSSTLPPLLTPSHGQSGGQPGSQASRPHGLTPGPAQTQGQSRPDANEGALKDLPVFHEHVDTTVSFGRSVGRKRQSSGASSSDDGDTIPWLFSKPREVAAHPPAPSGPAMSHSASKLKRGGVYTPDCKSLPYCSSVGASRKKDRTNYGLPQRVKRTALKLQDNPANNPDDSDDDFPIPDGKPLEASPPLTPEADAKAERLTAILESPHQASNDSGVAMATPTPTPSTEQRRPSTLSRALGNQDTLVLHTPSQPVLKPQCAPLGVNNGTIPSHSVQPQNALFTPSFSGTVQPPLQPPTGENELSQPRPVYNGNLAYTHQINPVVAAPQPIQRKDVITVNKVAYNILRVVGKGGSSKVYQVFCEGKKKVLAIKYVKLDCADDMTVQGYINEITLLQKLRKSENIIHLYDYEITDSHIYLVMECGSIDLATFLSKHKKIDPQNMKFYWRGMLDAVDVVHQAGIVHSDLKPANFLFVEGSLKLIDFGIANAIQSDKTSVVRESQVGTLNYMSPEAIQDTSPSPQMDANGHRRPRLKINCKSDVWSLGCIFYYMVYGKTPFQHITLSLMKLQAICDARHVIAFPPVDNPYLLDLLQKCLIRDPRERPSIQELRQHGFFQAEAWPAQEESSQTNLTEEHLKALISQLSQAQINSPTSISAVTKTLMQQLQSGQQLDISTFKKRPLQPVVQQPPPQAAPPPPPQQPPTFDHPPRQHPPAAHPRPSNRVPLQVVQMEDLRQAQSALRPLCSSQSAKYMSQQRHEKENQDLEAVLRGQLAQKYKNAIPVQNTEEQTFEQTWGTETMK